MSDPRRALGESPGDQQHEVWVRGRVAYECNTVVRYLDGAAVGERILGKVLQLHAGIVGADGKGVTAFGHHGLPPSSDVHNPSVANRLSTMVWSIPDSFARSNTV
jgi:hypothetical protein